MLVLDATRRKSVYSFALRRHVNQAPVTAVGRNNDTHLILAETSGCVRIGAFPVVFQYIRITRPNGGL